MTNVSLYIPNFNGARYICKTLEAVLEQTIPFSEIIVVDDGSHDASVSLARQYPVNVITHGRNCGVAAARNTGIRNAQHELIASIDVDCLLHPHWLAECIRFFDDPGVAGVGGRLYERRQHTVPDTWRRINLIQHFGNGIKEVAYLSGSNAIFRKAELVAVGLYNESFQRHQEDIDMSERLRARGRRLMYTSDAIVCHIKKDTWYSVMRSCWGFRHREYPRTFFCLVRAIVREIKHSISIILKSLMHARFRLLPLDGVYVFIQLYFCLKAYCLKTINFE